MARPMPEDAPVTMAALPVRSMTLVSLQQDLDEQCRRPGEEVGAVAHPRQRIEILVEALVTAQPDDGLAEARGLLLVAVALQPPHQEPVYVDPDRPSPVADREEPEAVPVVARHGRDALVRQAEAGA